MSSGDRGRPTQFCRPRGRTSATRGWRKSSPVWRAICGQRSLPEAAGNTAERECEAYYYAGEACLLQSDPVQARAWFEKCVQTGVEFDPDTIFLLPMNEYELAEWRLEALLVATTQPNEG